LTQHGEPVLIFAEQVGDMLRLNGKIFFRKGNRLPTGEASFGSTFYSVDPKEPVKTDPNYRGKPDKP
jgi:hypothetical protein